MSASSTSGTDVFILGAGFSKAVSDKLPTTDELGDDCLAIAGLTGQPGVPTGRFTGGKFEAWLSRIAEEQPYLDAVANANNHARFLAMRAAIHRRLTDATREALDAGWTPWLPMLLRLAHRSRATVITFNYDTVIECAVRSKAIHDLGTHSSVTVESVTGGVPPSPPMMGTGMSFGPPPSSASFRLLKLHGSLNWYWVDGDTTGTSMLAGPTPGYFGKSEPIDDSYLRQYLPGREPFVVPPATTKSSYLRNPIVRQVWADAFEALREARRVTFLGYSLPLEDGTFAGLLSEALGGRSGVTIDIADRLPNNVRAHLDAIGLAGPIDRVYGDMTSIPDLIDFRRDEAAAEACGEIEKSLAGVEPHSGVAVAECRLLVEFDSFLSTVVRSVSRDGDVVTLGCDSPQRLGSQMLQSQLSADRHLINGHELLGLIVGAQRLEAVSDGERHVVLSHDVDGLLGGPDGPWLVLGTATTHERASTFPRKVALRVGCTRSCPCSSLRLEHELHRASPRSRRHAGATHR